MISQGVAKQYDSRDATPDWRYSATLFVISCHVSDIILLNHPFSRKIRATSWTAASPLVHEQRCMRPRLPRHMQLSKIGASLVHDREDAQNRQGGAVLEAVQNKIFFGRMDWAGYGAHRIDTRHTAGGDVIPVAYSPCRPPRQV